MYRKAPSPRDIASLLADDNDTAWLMERRTVETAARTASGRLHYHQRRIIVQLIQDAADKAGAGAQSPLEQLEHGSTKRRETARKLGIDDPAESTPEGEAASYATEFVSALEAEAERPGADGAAIKCMAWCARQALHRQPQETAKVITPARQEPPRAD